VTRNLAILLFSLAFIALSLRELVARGGVSRPRTVISHSGIAPERAEAGLLLLQYASRTLPQYARVALIKPRGRWDDAGMLAVAHGQLPRQHAVPFGDAPDFVIAIDAPLEDPHFEKIYDAPGGSIWKRMR
jgi:hypothetical protein